MYLCNQQIYSPRHARHAAPQWERISADWPLRCVQFFDPHQAGFDREQFDQWLLEMQQDYELVSEEELPMTRFSKPENELIWINYVYVFKFRPRQTGAAPLVSHRRLHPPLRK